MKEYIHEKEETENILKKGKDGMYWLHSGDLGYMDSDGYIFFKSRLKRMIVSSGYNIYPGQIEQIILEHPYVEQCVVVGVPHPYKKEVVKAYIVLKKGLVLNSEIKRSIKDHCEKHIAKYALPYAYGYRKELPKTLIGKVAYKELINDKDEER
jgi:long-chain acyl-CoA synthetase